MDWQSPTFTAALEACLDEFIPEQLQSYAATGIDLISISAPVARSRYRKLLIDLSGQALHTFPAVMDK